MINYQDDYGQFESKYLIFDILNVEKVGYGDNLHSEQIAECFILVNEKMKLNTRAQPHLLVNQKWTVTHAWSHHGVGLKVAEKKKTPKQIFRLLCF